MNKIKEWLLAIGFVGLIVAAILASVALTLSDPQQSSPLKLKGSCPKTQVVGDVNDCFRCHAPITFRLKEPDYCAHIHLPDVPLRISCDSDGKITELIWFLTRIDSEQAESILQFAKDKGLNKLVIEIQSPGGSLFEAWRIVGMLVAAQKAGIVIETRTHGFAASAGFLILASGSRGHRYASKTAHLMWHELMSLSLFKIETPSSSEETSKTLRKLQDIANTWLASVSKMSKQEIDQMIKNKDFWMTGEEALERGFIDKLIE